MLTKANGIKGNYMFDNIILNLSSTYLANAVYLLCDLQYILDDKVVLSFHLYLQWMPAIRAFIPTIGLFLYFGGGGEKLPCFNTQNRSKSFYGL